MALTRAHVEAILIRRCGKLLAAADLDGTTGVYAIRNRRDGKVYVGSSQDVGYRWRKHRAELAAGRHANAHLQNAWRADGADAFECLMLEAVPKVAGLLPAEQKWIDSLKACDRQYGYNIALEAGAPMRGRKATLETRAKLARVWLGRKHTPDTIQKMKAVHKGRQYCLGRKLSDAHRAALADSNRRRGVSQQTRAKLRAANLGKKATLATRRKMSEARRTRRRNPNGTYASEC